VSALNFTIVEKNVEIFYACRGQISKINCCSQTIYWYFLAIWFRCPVDARFYTLNVLQ
jgi:hypothetical protein